MREFFRRFLGVSRIESNQSQPPPSDKKPTPTEKKYQPPQKSETEIPPQKEPAVSPPKSKKEIARESIETKINEVQLERLVDRAPFIEVQNILRSVWDKHKDEIGVKNYDIARFCVGSFFTPFEKKSSIAKFPDTVNRFLKIIRVPEAKQEHFSASYPWIVVFLNEVNRFLYSISRLPEGELKSELQGVIGPAEKCRDEIIRSLSPQIKDPNLRVGDSISPERQESYSARGVLMDVADRYMDRTFRNTVAFVVYGFDDPDAGYFHDTEIYTGRQIINEK